MEYEIAVRSVHARPTAVVAATTTWSAWPTLWPQLSGEVWACLRAGGIQRGCPNVMLYRGSGNSADDEVHVEVGVELRQPCQLTGRVISSTLPAGEAAMTVHYGPYARLGDAYDALVQWCAHHGLARTPTRWEVYGPHRDDPAELRTDIYWLLEPALNPGT